MSVVLLTEEQVSAWKKRKQGLETTIAEAQQELLTINRRLEAVAILTDGRPSDSPVPSAGHTNGSATTQSMTEAVEQIVGAVSEPMTKAALKEALLGRGFPQEKLGNYFYTVIMRLKQKRRINVGNDGKVSAAIFP